MSVAGLFRVCRGFVDGRVRLGLKVRNVLAIVAPQLDRDVLVDGAGMRLLLGDAKFREQLQNFVSFDFQFPGQLVNANLSHRQSNLLVPAEAILLAAVWVFTLGLFWSGGTRVSHRTKLSFGFFFRLLGSGLEAFLRAFGIVKRTGRVIGLRDMVRHARRAGLGIERTGISSLHFGQLFLSGAEVRRNGHRFRHRFLGIPIALAGVFKLAVIGVDGLLDLLDRLRSDTLNL
jgi:hypothetical protein